MCLTDRVLRTLPLLLFFNLSLAKFLNDQIWMSERHGIHFSFDMRKSQKKNIGDRSTKKRSSCLNDSR